MSLHIQLEKFEGPLGLLLHLIRKEEMDIFDINVHHITGQYLSYIKVMKKLDLEVAGEFIAMAATLIHIKSKMLLPNYDDNGEEIEVEDPRKELVQKLLEYQKYKEASGKLYDRALVGRDVWLRGARENLNEYRPEEEIVIEDNPLFSLIAAYRWSIKNMKKTVHNVMKELQSISERVIELKERLVMGRTVKFYELIDVTGTYRQNQVLITFLSMLELAKVGFVSLFQAEALSEIHVTTLKNIDDNALERVEDYETGTEAGGVQASLFDNNETEAVNLNFEESDEEAGAVESEEPSFNHEVKVVQAQPQDEPMPEEIASDEDIEREEELLRMTNKDETL